MLYLAVMEFAGKDKKGYPFPLDWGGGVCPHLLASLLWFSMALPQGTHCILGQAHLNSLHNHCLHHTSSSEGYSGHCYTWTGQACRSCWHSVSCLHQSYPGNHSPSHTARPLGCNACWHTAIHWIHTGDALQTRHLVKNGSTQFTLVQSGEFYLNFLSPGLHSNVLIVAKDQYMDRSSH